MSGRKVCTKLVLYLTENIAESEPSKVVLHFYHTSSTMHAQGSAVLSCGTSAPVWIVKQFLEPLAISHTNHNNAEIEAINNDIRESSKQNCAHCNSEIKTTAVQPKDQQLPCRKCGKLYHKRCTDRRSTTGNWKRSPWFCQSCIRDEYNMSNQNLSVTIPRQALVESAVAETPNADAGDNVMDTIEDLTGDIPPDLDPEAIEFLPPSVTTGNDRSTTDAAVTLPNNNKDTTVFPRNNTRQRASNINIVDAEKEFLDTAVKACRSTIVQQETELKRLKENLDIRNKRISQLENQVSEAADKIAGRDPPQQTPDRQPGLEESLRMVLAKLEQSMTSPSIVINNNQNGFPVKPSQANQYSQTDAIMKCDDCSSEQQLQNNLELHEPPEHTEVSDSCAAFHPCKVCEQLFESVTALESHMANHSSTHGSLLSQTCTECGRKFWSVEHLLELSTLKVSMLPSFYLAVIATTNVVLTHT